jgi:hypothetical protein
VPKYEVACIEETETMRMTLLGATWLIAIAVAGTGCKDEGLEALRAIKAKACACKDVACVNEAKAETAAAGRTKRTRNLDEAKRIVAEIGTCMEKVTGAAAPEEPAAAAPTAPPAPGPAPAAPGPAPAAPGPAPAAPPP